MSKKIGAIKRFRSEGYNYNYNLDNGDFERWGKTESDDPLFSRFGPEILDIEVSTICNGPTGKAPCKFCYKSNTCNGKNMSLNTFIKIFDKLPNTLTQIAFGIGDLKANSDLIGMFEYCYNNGKNIVIPNITINGFDLDEEYIEKLVDYCGAISVSCYEPKDICYNTVKELTDRGLKQCNIHMLLSEETYNKCIELVEDTLTDSRLSKLNAVVFLMLKPKGNRNTYTSITDLYKIENLINKAMDKNPIIGMDSCSSPIFLHTIKNNKNFKGMAEFVEPCESGLFSLYINVDGEVYPCSFTEGEHEWRKGLSVVECENFLKDIWFHDKIKQWRNNLIQSSQNCNCSLKKHCRSCPAFSITTCKGGNE